MFQAAVVGHGDFATGLVSAVREICGRDESFLALSNRDYAVDVLEQRLREIVDTGVKVVFTDLPGGSASVAARRILRDTPDLVIVSGTNLAALLAFVLHPLGDASETARMAAAKGQAAILAISASE